MEHLEYKHPMSILSTRLGDNRTQTDDAGGSMTFTRLGPVGSETAVLVEGDQK